MYARLARFEGSDRAVLEREIEGMRKQIESSSAEDPSGQLDREQMQFLLGAIKRTTLLVDRDKGSSAMVVFCDSEEDIRRIDQMFDQMSPPDEGGGKRQSVDIYEVAIDEPSGG